MDTEAVHPRTSHEDDASLLARRIAVAAVFNLVWVSALVLLLMLVSRPHFSTLLPAHVSDRDAALKEVFSSPLLSDHRGYVALMYSGTARGFSRTFRSHIINILAGSPYTVHLYIHTYAHEFRKAAGTEPLHLSINSTLRYHDSYVNLDGQRVSLIDSVKGYTVDYSTLEDVKSRYAEQLTFIMARHPWTYEGDNGFEAATLVAMIHSQAQCGELRHAYMRRTGIEYKWVLRMRLDLLVRSNLWEIVFRLAVFDANNVQHQSVKTKRDESLRRSNILTQSNTAPAVLSPVVDLDAPEGALSV